MSLPHRGGLLAQISAGSNVEGGIVKNSGHWIMEEQPDQTVKVIKAFLEKK